MDPTDSRSRCAVIGGRCVSAWTCRPLSCDVDRLSSLCPCTRARTMSLHMTMLHVVVFRLCFLACLIDCYPPPFIDMMHAHVSPCCFRRVLEPLLPPVSPSAAATPASRRGSGRTAPAPSAGLRSPSEGGCVPCFRGGRALATVACGAWMLRTLCHTPWADCCK